MRLQNMSTSRSGVETEFHLRPPYQLVLLGNRLNATNSKHYLARYGVGVIEGRVLCALADADQAAATDISAKLGIDQASVSRALRALVDSQLVEILHDKNDGRRRLLHLTATGYALQEKLVADILHRTEIALDGFSPAERSLLSEFIKRLMANVAALEIADQDT
jgi:DNA-binding MarR family transcriptional regulator